VIELRSTDLVVEIDPDHGAEIIEVIDSRTGFRLLGHPPFDAEAPCGGDLDEESWTARYRGGWQLLCPNAGNASQVGPARHGFHGRASIDPWELISAGPDRALLRWSGHGLELSRSVTLQRDTIAVELQWRATGAPAPLVAVEHVVFGRAMLDPACVISAEAVAHELSETDGPVWPPADATPWPGVRRRDGTVTPSGSQSLQPPRAGLAVLTGWTQGRATLANAAARVSVELEWDAARLGAVWLWEEIRASGGIWDQQTELLGFELASVPHSLGLARAVEEGQAWWAQPDEPGGYRMTMRVRVDR
jgi:hypothetical protein